MPITPSVWTVLQEPRDTTRLISLLNQRLGQELYVEVEAIRAIVDSGGETAETITILPSISDASALTITQTWNTGGTTFKAINVAITNTASAAGSLLASYSVGGTVVHSVSYAGNGYFAGTVGVGTPVVATTGVIVGNAALAGLSQFGVVSNPVFSSAATTSADAIYARVQTAVAAFTMTYAAAIEIGDAVLGTGSAIITQYGLYVASLTAGGTNYAIYTNVGAVRFGGAVTAASTLAVTSTAAIGTTALAYVGLHMNIATLAGVAQYGVLSYSTFTSSATTSGTQVYVQVNTTAATFTMAKAYGIYIDTPSTGAASAITDTYGLFIAAQTGGGLINPAYAWYAKTNTRDSYLSQSGVLVIGSGITASDGTLTLTQVTANTAVIASTGHSLTGSSAVGAVSYAGTWNTSGTPTAFSVAITNTASNAASKLFNFLAGTSGATSLLSLTVTGATTGLLTVDGSSYGANVASLRLNGLTTTGGANVGTLTNCPHTGNPGVWVPINVAGTVFLFPGFATS